LSRCFLFQFRQFFHNLHRLHTYRYHLFNQAHNVFRIIGPVGVIGDAAAFVGFDAVLVNNPIESRAVAEAIFKDFGGNAGEGEEVVVDEESNSIVMSPK
jgi:hypothetical protein